MSEETTEATLNHVVERLDRLERTLSRLLEIAEHRSNGAGWSASRPTPAASSPAPQSPPSAGASAAGGHAVAAGASAEPPTLREQIAARAKGEDLASAAAPEPNTGAAEPSAAPGAGGSTASPEPLVGPQVHSRAGGTSSSRPDASEVEPDMRALLTGMFEAAMQPAEEETWEILTELTHHDDLVAPRALAHLKAFNWRKLRRATPRYLERAQDPSSFRIIRVSHSETENEQWVRLFVEPLDGASPAPVTLRRDPEAQGAWRITQISL